MREETLTVEFSSSDGGMENTVKIRDEQDLQVAVEALQLAARYEFDADIEVTSGSSGEEVSELVERTEQLEEELDGAEQDIGELIEESVSDSDLESRLSEFQEEVIEKLSEMIVGKAETAFSSSDEDVESRESGSTGPEDEESSEDNQEQDEDESADETEEDSDDSSYMEVNEPSKTVAEIVKDALVDVDTPLDYEEFKDLTETEQQVAIYEAMLRVQPGTKVEIADEILDSDVRDSNGKRAKYVENRLNNQMSDFVDTGRRSIGRGRNPIVFAEAGFDFEEDSEGGDQEDVEDRDSEEASDGTGSEVEKGAYDLEWKTVDQAVADYKDIDDLKYLLCIRSMKAYTSPLMAENHAEEGEGAVWAASEDLPEEFVS